ncbi:MAG: helical backbone metal receptor [Bacteroidota bacterium]
MGVEINISFPPKRIISLVPSQTELLAALGLNEQLVGITKFCVHPPTWLGAKNIVGGTKNFNFEIIDDLKPDLIIGNKEENYEEGIRALRVKYAVWMSDIASLCDALDMIKSIGELTDHAKKARQLIHDIEFSFRHLKKKVPANVLYLIWRKPWMAVGHGTFIHTMIETIGWQNCLHEMPRYPRLTAEEIQALKPDYILLSSEPYPFQEKHKQELQNLCPDAKIALVDGEMFSWYGSRLVKAPAYFNSLMID